MTNPTPAARLFETVKLHPPVGCPNFERYQCPMGGKNTILFKYGESYTDFVEIDHPAAIDFGIEIIAATFAAWFSYQANSSNCEITDLTREHTKCRSCNAAASADLYQSIFEAAIGAE